MLCKKKLAFYIRLSLEDFDLKTSDKTESNSVSNQRKLLQDYYDSHPELKEYEIIEFCDDGYTGTNFDRPRFMAMMELARQKEIHAIIVKDLSRFGRDYLEVGAYLELILPLFGTRFISVNDNFDSNNYVGTTGGLELALRNLINGLYSKDLSVKIKSANKTRSRRGEYWGGTAFYGYRLDPKNKHKIIVDTDVASVIVRIFDECIEGKSSSQTARGLNDEGIPSPAAYKQITGDFYNGRVADEVPIWTASTVLRILKDERYTGKMVSNKRETVGVSTGKMRPLPKEEWIIVDGTHEAIIPQAKFDEAATSRVGRVKTINKNTAGNRADNLFVCGHCGRKLQKSYGIITHLFCMKAGVSSESLCASIHEPIEDLKAKVLLVSKTLAKMLMEKSVQVKATTNQEIPRTEKKIAEAKRSLQRLQNGKLDLYEEYRQGKITREKFISIQECRQADMDSLQDELAKLEQYLAKIKSGREKIDELTADAKDIWALSEYRPEVIRKIVERVRVYENGRIEIDLLNNDDFITEILESAVKMAG